MRRLLHYLFTFCAIVSLLLCIGIAVLWVRSHWLQEVFVHRARQGNAQGTQCILLSNGIGCDPQSLTWVYWRLALRGPGAGLWAAIEGMTDERLGLRHQQSPAPAGPRPAPPARPGVPAFEFGGISVRRQHDEQEVSFGEVRRGMPLSPGATWGITDQVDVTIPNWLALSITAVLPAWESLRWLKCLRRRQRLRRGLCANCGYDLRASGGHCPECGAATTRVLLTSVPGESP
jgi:hypothetical protein